ncbi:MAG: sulfatase [Acidobacteriota bacterium]
MSITIDSPGRVNRRLGRVGELVIIMAMSSLMGLAQSGRPNILFISVDDLNNDLGCYGNSTVQSPQIDRLAARGVRFDRAYTQYPLCNPSRASLLSGRRPERTGIYELQTAPRRAMPEAIFLPQLFRRNGYFTARYGKIYHEGRDDRLSWDISDSSEFVDEEERRAHQLRYARPQNERTPDWRPLDTPEPLTRDARTVAAVARLMEEQVAAGRPFFLAAGLNKPHLPWNVPKSYYGLYAADQLRLAADPPMRRIPLVALMTELYGAAQPSSREEAVAAYYAAISYMDRQVGVLLDQLDRLKLWERTIVVLFSDHGFHLGDHGGLWAKLTLFEQSARTPLLIAAPTGRRAEASPRVVELLDLYPTLAELAGLEVPPGLEGRSLVPLLREPRRRWDHVARTMVYHETKEGKVEGRSICDERWRYTEWDGGERGRELYDHRRDPREFNNLAGLPQYAGTERRLRQQLASMPRPVKAWETQR